MKKMVSLASKTSNKIIFINAWNEWGEGMYLQGDCKYPTERLTQLARALN